MSWRTAPDSRNDWTIMVLASIWSASSIQRRTDAGTSLSSLKT
jgi:hypothetical protein